MTTIKKTLFLLTFSIMVLSSINSINAQGFNLPTDYIRNNVQGNNIKFAEVKGSPYTNVNFVSGKVNIKDNSYFALLRYNAFNDEIEMKEDNDQIISLLKRNYIKVSLGGEKFGIYSFTKDNGVKQGYFVELTDTDSKVMLLRRNKKVLLEAQEATSSYKKGNPARLIDEESHYLKIDENPAKLIKLNKKSILSMLTANKAAIASYVKENKYKLKKESEVIALVNYYNSL